MRGRISTEYQRWRDKIVAARREYAYVKRGRVYSMSRDAIRQRAFRARQAKRLGYRVDIWAQSVREDADTLRRMPSTLDPARLSTIALPMRWTDREYLAALKVLLHEGLLWNEWTKRKAARIPAA